MEDECYHGKWVYKKKMICTMSLGDQHCMFTKLELLSRSCGPAPTGQVGVYLHICPDIYDTMYIVTNKKSHLKLGISKTKEHVAPALIYAAARGSQHQLGPTRDDYRKKRFFFLNHICFTNPD